VPRYVGNELEASFYGADWKYRVTLERARSIVLRRGLEVPRYVGNELEASFYGADWKCHVTLGTSWKHRSTARTGSATLRYLSHQTGTVISLEKSVLIPCRASAASRFGFKPISLSGYIIREGICPPVTLFM